MSHEHNQDKKSSTAPGTETHPRHPQKIVLRSYPKIILLYPTLAAAALAAMGSSWEEGHRWGLLFLLVFFLNLIVLSFDFPRTTSLTLTAVIVAIVCGSLWVNSRFFLFLPELKKLTDLLNPQAKPQFYWLLVVGLLVIYVLVFIDTRFDYWEVMPNEIMHHHGILGNVKRYPAPQLKLEKEITDVFEFFLLRSGRLLIHPSGERITIVLDNVPNINKREAEIQALLRVLDVHVRTDDDAADE